MTAITHHCSECGRAFEAATARRITCGDRCRVRRHRRRHADAAAARARALDLLLEHGRQIRASITSGVEPDRAELDRLAAAMDAASDCATAILRRL